MKINIKCVVPISEYKIHIIKLLRQTFNLSLKEGKDIADQFHDGPTVVYDGVVNYDVYALNANFGRLPGTGALLEYSLYKEPPMENMLPRLYALIWNAVEWNEPRLAEDLLKAYNKHAPKPKK
jgi:hypothetical protein